MANAEHYGDAAEQSAPKSETERIITLADLEALIKAWGNVMAPIYQELGQLRNTVSKFQRIFEQIVKQEVRERLNLDQRMEDPNQCGKEMMDPTYQLKRALDRLGH